MTRTMTLRSLLVVFACAPVAVAAAQQADFRWEKALAAGKRVSIHNINGDVTVATSTSGKVEVVGVKHGSKRDFDDLTIDVVETNDGVTVCAINKRLDMECDDRGIHVHDHWGNRDWDDASIDIQVKLPKALEVDAHSVSGDVSVGIDALTGNGPLSFTSVSGSVTADLPKSIDADVTMRSVSGTLDSEFPLTLNGRMGRHSLEARIGKGGRELQVHTVSGDVRLRQNKP